MAKVIVELTPAQARAVNGALAYVTAGDWTDGGMSHPAEWTAAVNAQKKVQAALREAGVIS